MLNRVVCTVERVLRGRGVAQRLQLAEVRIHKVVQEIVFFRMEKDDRSKAIERVLDVLLATPVGHDAVLQVRDLQ